MSSAPDISIVICTLNRVSCLPQALARWNTLPPGEIPFELILVDNGSNDGTAAVLEEFSQQTPLDVAVARQPLRGLSRARNTGWPLARGKIVAFTDDDCYPAEDFIAALSAAFADSAVDYVGGRVLLFDPDDYPITIQTRADHVSFPAHLFVKAGLIHGANFACRRRVLDALRGFDKQLGAGARIPSGEDFDFQNRASCAGFAGIYDPRVVVWHHHRRRHPHDVEKLERDYDVGRGAVYAKGLLDERRRRLTFCAWATATWRTFRYLRPLSRNVRMLFRELTGAVQYVTAHWRDDRHETGAT
jgi:glycosyltransferase involved in cell wall biosynthesis